MNKRCQYCGKKLKKKKYFHKYRGWRPECNYSFLKRKSCNKVCGNFLTQLNSGHRMWTKVICKKEFRKIKSKNKYNTNWLRRYGYDFLIYGIYSCFGQNGWYKFLRNIKKLNKLKINYVYPKKEQWSKEYIKLGKEELDWKVGDEVEISSRDSDLFSITGNYWNSINTINYLVSKRIIKLIKRGLVGGIRKSPLIRSNPFSASSRPLSIIPNYKLYQRNTYKILKLNL